jgi:division protein CdvB (Snf7/Vps24/ESCRT-III family)
MGLQNNPEYRLGELITKARAINEKSAVVKTMCQDLTTRLDSLIQGYSDGDITEDSVKTAFEAMSNTTSGLSKVKERMQPVMDEVSSKFAQSMEAWNALPESERNKILKPGTAGQPTGVSTGRPGAFDPALQPISGKPRGGN